MRDTLGKACGETKMVVKSVGGVSGGTLATALGFKKNAKGMGLKREDLKGEGGYASTHSALSTLCIFCRAKILRSQTYLAALVFAVRHHTLPEQPTLSGPSRD